MKRFGLTILMLATVFSQIAMTHVSSSHNAGPNFFLVFLVVASLFLDYSVLIWLALIGGFILDLYSGNDFGLNMAFYILLVIAIKAILSLSESPTRNSYVIIVIAFATVFYNIIMSLGLVGLGGTSLKMVFLKPIAIEILYNVTLAIIALGVVYSFSSRDKTSKVYKLGKLK